jgi:CubicO group peptidase (beta-lactamase class C family)
MRVPAIFAALAVAFLPLAAAEAAPTPVAEQARDALIRSVPVEGPGAVVLITRGETTIYSGAVGQADLELGVPLSPDQVFRIASVTKMFTAATVLKLAEQGKLSLDDKLSAYVADIPNGDQITIRQLLNHTAGVSDIVHTITPGFSRRDVDTATLLEDVKSRPPAFAPGARWSYSNAGFILLGAVIEKATGKRWYEAVQDEVVAPVGLKRTVFGAAAPLIPGRVAGYTTDSRTHAVRNANAISSTIPAAAGGLVSTADDLTAWMRALVGGRLLDKASLEVMRTPAPDLPGASPASRYGLGLYLWTVRGAPMIGHTGQIDGFASMVAYLPDQDVTIVVLANDDEFDAQTLGRRLAAIAVGQPYAVVTPVAPSAATQAALAGTYRFPDGTIETLSIKDGQLFAQRGSRNVIPLQMTVDGRLYFKPDELTYFAPVRDARGKITRLDYFPRGDGPPQAVMREP